MIEIEIPGFQKLQLEHLVLDYNGTLACDGSLMPGVRKCLRSLAEGMEIHVLTADTFGSARQKLSALDCRFSVVGRDDQDQSKLQYIKDLGPEKVVGIGNGRNDRLMLKEAVLGIAVVSGEGAAREALQAADVVCGDIIAALELLLNPLRLVATLRL